MKKLVLLSIVITALAAPAFAQYAAAGLMIGAAQPMKNGFHTHFNDRVSEAFLQFSTDADTAIKVKVGQVPLDSTEGGVDVRKTIDYADLLVEYKIDEVWGSTGLFGGLGMYRQRFADTNESNWGYSLGLNGTFPVTRRFALMAEFAYHSMHFHEQEKFLTASGGIKVSF